MFHGGPALHLAGMRIAYLEDDAAQAALLRGWLEAAGHICHHFGRTRDFQASLSRESFDLYLLDWHLPDGDGLEALRWIRERAARAPVVFVTLRDREEDVARVLNAGADDYISKPVRRGELLARIDAVARRALREDPLEKLAVPPFVIDRESRRIERDGAEVALTDKEYELALFLFRHLGKLLSRRHLLEAVWGTRGDPNTRTVDTHISRLRSKLGLTADQGWKLRSVHQFGYRLERL